jgi:hypothetical protein
MRRPIASYLVLVGRRMQSKGLQCERENGSRGWLANGYPRGVIEVSDLTGYSYGSDVATGG